MMTNIRVGQILSTHAMRIVDLRIIFLLMTGSNRMDILWRKLSMKFNLFDFWEFEIDWKAMIGIGLLVVGYALLNM